MRRALSLAFLLIAICSTALALSHSSRSADSNGKPSEASLAGSTRKPPINGWTMIHLSGTPTQVGYQHGYLLSTEIADLQKVFLLELTHDTGKDWNFFRDAANRLVHDERPNHPVRRRSW